MMEKGSLSKKLSAIAFSVGMMTTAGAHAEDTPAQRNDQLASISQQAAMQAESSEEIMQNITNYFRLPLGPEKNLNVPLRPYLYRQDPDNKLDRDLFLEILSAEHTDRVSQNDMLHTAPAIAVTQRRFEAIYAIASGKTEKDPTLKSQYEREFAQNFPMINVLVIKSEDKRFNKWYERGILTSMRNVTNSFGDEKAKVTNVFQAYPEEGIKRQNGQSTSGGIMIYVNDWNVIAFHPKSYDNNEEFVNNVKRAQTYIAYLFENNLHTKSEAELNEYISQQSTKRALTNNSSGEGSAAGSSDTQSEPDGAMLNPG